MKVTNIEVKPREWGHNTGIPMVHVGLSNTSGPKVDGLVEEIVMGAMSITSESMRKTNHWICLETADDGVPTGIGSLVTALISCQFDLDLHIQNPTLPNNGSTSPAWISKPRTVVVNYLDEGNLNYYSLSKNDVILFRDADKGSFEELDMVFDELKFVPATRWISTNEESFLNLVKESQGSRLSWVS